jgi:hypothetical protein
MGQLGLIDSSCELVMTYAISFIISLYLILLISIKNPMWQAPKFSHWIQTPQCVFHHSSSATIVPLGARPSPVCLVHHTQKVHNSFRVLNLFLNCILRQPEVEGEAHTSASGGIEKQHGYSGTHENIMVFSHLCVDPSNAVEYVENGTIQAEEEKWIVTVFL